MQCLSKKISDKRFLVLINHLLRTPIQEGKQVIANEIGCPQGGLCKALHKPPYAKKNIMQSKCLIH